MAYPLPLTLLREFNINKMEIMEKEGRIYFGDLSWPKDVQTNFVMWTEAHKIKATKNYYTLDSLLYILKNKSLIHPVYARKAELEKIPVVRRPDRKQLLAYLNGEIDTCPSIEENVIVTDDEVEPAAKKPKLAKEINTSLSEALSVEKIAEIKAKRMAKKEAKSKVV